MQSQSPITARDVAIAAIGVGVTAGVGYLAYLEYHRHKLIREFLEAAREYELELARYAADGVIDPGEEAALQAKRERMEFLEKELEKIPGGITGLLWELARVGIIGYAGYVTLSVVKKLAERYLKKPPKCPVCGIQETSEYRLERHVKAEHPIKPEGVPEAEAEWIKLPNWVQGIWSWVTGVPAQMWREWSKLPIEKQIELILLAALAIAALVIIIWAWPAVMASVKKISLAIFAAS